MTNDQMSLIYSPSYKTLAKVLDYNVVYINGSAPEANTTLDKYSNNTCRNIFLKPGGISVMSSKIFSPLDMSE